MVAPVMKKISPCSEIAERRFIVKVRQVIGIAIYLVLITSTFIPPKDR